MALVRVKACGICLTDYNAYSGERTNVIFPDKVRPALKSKPKVWEAFQKISPSHQRNYILWLTDAKKPETFERRLNALVDEIMAGTPQAMH